MSFLLKEDGDRLLKEDGDALLLDVAPVVVVTFPVLPPTLESVLAGSHTPVVRLLFLENDLETVMHEVSQVLTEEGESRQLALSGEVTFDRFRDEHAQASVTLVAPDDRFRPREPDDLVWQDRVVRIERGALVTGVPQYVTLMTGLIDVTREQLKSGAVSFSVWSRLHKANRTFAEPVTFAAGERISVVVRAIAELAGLGTSDALYDLTTGGQTLPEPLSCDSDDNMLAVMVRLAFDAGADLYDTGEGVLTLRPFGDPAAETPVWEFAPGSTSTLLDLSVTRRALAVYNRQQVTAYLPGRYALDGEARITDPSNPLFWTADNDRPAPPYTIDTPATQQMVNAVARRLLFERSTYEEAVEFSSVVIPLLRARSVVGIVAAGIDARAILDQVRTPLGPGGQTMSTRRVRSLAS